MVEFNANFKGLWRGRAAGTLIYSTSTCTEPARTLAEAGKCVNTPAGLITTSSNFPFPSSEGANESLKGS